MLFARLTFPRAITNWHMPKRSSKTERVKKKNQAAVALGRLGGLKGGKARAAKLSAKRRSEIAHHAASARVKKISPRRRKEIARIASLARWSKQNL